MKFGLQIIASFAAVIAAAIIFGTFERPPVMTVQRGYRGTAMEQVYNPRLLSVAMAANIAPASLPQASAEGPKAGVVYKNVQVLKDVSVAEFTRLMVSMTTWVAPQQGCAYCHRPAEMASDALYTKVVARRMLQMVRHINADWTTHVAGVGVTCYTCHRGQPVPAVIWWNEDAQAATPGVAIPAVGKNHPSAAAGASSLPSDPFTPFLEQANDIRVEATQALPGTDDHSIKQTDWTYALMIHFSEALGVNCTYCHNTRQFASWSQSTPQRVTAWYGIRMVRDLNTDYLDPLADVFPPQRLGPLGDSPKLNCATCHRGAYKPLFGVAMAKDFPELTGAAHP